MKRTRHGARREQRHQERSGEKGGRRGYHHGNLKEALVAAAKQLILEKGPHGFSLIEAARLADVSPAAPYRHFRDKEALLAEVARRGFEAFAAALTAAWDDGRPDPETALRHMGQAYLDFARTERASYAAMFEAGLAMESDPELKAAAGQAFMALSRVADNFAHSDATGDGDPPVSSLQIFFHIWSLAHGAATLSAGGTPEGGISRERAEEMLDAGMAVYLKGLRAG